LCTVRPERRSIERLQILADILSKSIVLEIMLTICQMFIHR
jgi:hypothetical protein